MNRKLIFIQFIGGKLIDQPMILSYLDQLQYKPFIFIDISPIYLFILVIFYSTIIFMKRFNPSPERSSPKNQQHIEQRSNNPSDSNVTPFGGGHAFRSIQPSDNSHDTNNNFASYLQNFQRNNQIIVPQNSPYEDKYAHEANYNQLISNSLLSLGLPQNSTTCSTQMIMSLFEIVEKQTLALEKLNKKVEETVEKNKELNNKIHLLEEEKRAGYRDDKRQGQSLILSNKRLENSITPYQKMAPTMIEGESVSSTDLIKILFGIQDYQYHLKLSQELELPLYRERNFSIDIELIDLNGNKIENSNKIPMSLAIYTCENPPKFIEKNTGGQKMLKGYVDQSLINGICRFEKVQVREVTSHFRDGWVFFVVIPCMPPLGAIKNDKFIDFTKIKPLVIGEVVVKAKKPKRKDTQKEKKSFNDNSLNKKDSNIKQESEEWEQI